MKQKCYTLLCLLLTVRLCSVGQNIPPSMLVERHNITSKPYYCLKNTTKRFTGKVSGFVIPRQTDIGCVTTVSSLLQNYCFENNVIKDFNYWDIPIYIEGFLKNGKEVGLWELSGISGQKVASLYFDSMKIIKYEIFLNDSLIYKGCANSNIRKRRKTNNRFKNNPLHCSQICVLPALGECTCSKVDYAVQHLHYLPWGEDFVSQRRNSFEGARYTFSAKEKDVETGLSVTSLRSVSSSSLSQIQTSLTWHSLIRRFGSCYYSSDLSIWLSVDPQAAKYLSLSSYVYCANNPVKLVDSNGEDYGIPPWLLIKGIARIVEATSNNPDVKTVVYAIKHPINDMRIKCVHNVAATNFQVNIGKAINSPKKTEGSPQNAIRHTLWQALITRDADPKHAKKLVQHMRTKPLLISTHRCKYSPRI